MNLLYYIPYLYLIKTRLQANGRLISYFFILLLPPIYIAVVLQSNLGFSNLIIAILGQLLVQNLYEIGYIQNDTETVKHEKTPTLRLSETNSAYYEKNKINIYLSRLLISVFLTVTLLFLTKSSFETILFLSAAYLIVIIYVIYNSIRNFWNLILHLLLNVIKFTAIQLLFLKTAHLRVFIISLFAYPLINFIDRATTPRFFFKLSTIYKITEFRVFYYFILLLIFGFFFLNDYVTFWEYLVIIYYFIYRLSIKIGLVLRTKKII
jgi:hypothetical protein